MARRIHGFRGFSLVLGASALSGCMGFLGGDEAPLDWTPMGPNFAVGSTLSASLSQNERQALARAFLEALSAPAPRAAVSWETGRASGAVMAGETLLRKIYADPEKTAPAPAGLEIGAAFETELGEYVARDEVPLRLAPEAIAPETGRLRGGDVFVAAGRIVNGDWLLVERDGRILGYAPTSLARPRPGRPAVLAGGPRRTVELCRRFTQQITLQGREDRYDGLACREGAGQWRIQYAPPPDA